ncbi:MAG: type I-F CRISPR-associated protein Csy2 [Neisseria sp.]|nr:type I-F CRISPR-associated protein Csy2 [Neisseria sp.]
MSPFYLLLDKIDIQAANAVSGPLSYGFPALSAFLGAVHALNRRLPEPANIRFGGVLIAAHDCQVKHFRAHPFADAYFNQSRHPLKKDGSVGAIIEEGKVDLTVSLLIEVFTADEDSYETLNDQTSAAQWCTHIKPLLLQQRIAGGSVFDVAEVRLLPSHNKQEMVQALVPAFVLMNAEQALIEITKELQKTHPDATALNALIETATLHHLPPDKGEDEWRTRSVKSGRGWLVPLPIGYQGIAPSLPAGSLKNCRSEDYPAHYVETVYSLGQWIFPYRLPAELEGCFWRYAPVQNDLYLITQSTQP